MADGSEMSTKLTDSRGLGGFKARSYDFEAVTTLFELGTESERNLGLSNRACDGARLLPCRTVISTGYLIRNR